MDFDLDDDDKEEEDTPDGQADGQPHFEKDCIIFLVDARRSMISAEVAGQKSRFLQALSCIASCMRERIVSGDSDLVGVVLFGTAESRAPNEMQPFPHTYVLLEPEVPSGAAIRELTKLVETADLSAFGCMADAAELELSNTLWLVAMLLNATPRARACRKRVIVISDDDDPSAAKADAKQRAMLRAKDLADAKVKLEPIFLKPAPPRHFDLSHSSFWKQLLDEAQPAHAETGVDEASEAESWTSGLLCVDEEALSARVRRTQHRKRAYGSVDLRISESQLISLRLVTVVQPFAKPAATKLHAASNEALASERTLLCNQHGSVLQPSDTFKAKAHTLLLLDPAYCLWTRWRSLMGMLQCVVFAERCRLPVHGRYSPSHRCMTI